MAIYTYAYISTDQLTIYSTRKMLTYLTIHNRSQVGEIVSNLQEVMEGPDLTHYIEVKLTNVFGEICTDTFLLTSTITGQHIYFPFR